MMEGETMLRRITLRHVMIAVIVAFVAYAEYVLWIKSPNALRSAELFDVTDQASAAGYEPLHLIDKAVRACDGESIDVEDSGFR
jgi:hypothetical protein